MRIEQFTIIMVGSVNSRLLVFLFLVDSWLRDYCLWFINNNYNYCDITAYSSQQDYVAGVKKYSNNQKVRRYGNKLKMKFKSEKKIKIHST